MGVDEARHHRPTGKVDGVRRPVADGVDDRRDPPVIDRDDRALARRPPSPSMSRAFQRVMVISGAGRASPSIPGLVPAPGTAADRCPLVAPCVFAPARLVPAPAPRPRTSGARSRRARPLGRSSSRTGPIRTRTSRSTGAPTAPNIRRSWRFQPCARIARYQTRAPGGGAMSSMSRRVSISVVGRSPVSVASPSSSWMPALSAGDLLRGQRRAQPDRVFALDAVARMEDAVGPGAVVGQDEQALRVLVEAPDRVEPAPSGRSAVGIMSSTVFEAWRSRTVEVTPAGLWSSRYSGAERRR